jgi:ankyrin repeat protein
MDRRTLAALALIAAAYLLWSLQGNETLAESAARRSPLHEAAYRGDAEQLRDLLEAGADANATDSLGLTPLQHAVSLEAHQHHPQGEHLACTQILLKKGAKAEPDGDSRRRPLLRGLWSPEIVEQLLAAGADPSRDAPLAAASSLGADLCQAAARSIRLLAKAGADVNAPDGSGFPPLALAAVNGCPGMVGALLEAGADPRAQVGRGAKEGQGRDLLAWVRETQALHQKGVFGGAWKEIHAGNLRLIEAALTR